VAGKPVKVQLSLGIDQPGPVRNQLPCFKTQAQK